MFLKEWIKYKGFNYKTFASEISSSHRNVERWARGERMPRWKEAEKIFEFTNNEVTGQDLYDKQIQRYKTDV